MTSHYRIFLAASLLALVTACSAANYQKPVGDFAAATENATKVMVALNQQITVSYADSIRAEVLAGNRLLMASSGDCELVGSKRCWLVTVKQDGSEELFDPDPVLGNMVTLMGLIDTYSKGLAEIVNADTAAKVAANVNSTLGSVENLAKTVDDLSGSGMAATVSGYKTPVGKAINWLVGNYVAKIQLDGLREATGAANPVILQAATIFEDTAEIASVIANAAPQQKFEAARQKFEDDIDAGKTGALKGNVTALASAAAAYDRILVAKPSSVFAKFGEAHAALTGSLQGDDVSLITVAAKVEAFAAEAKALAEIIREFSEANPN